MNLTFSVHDIWHRTINIYIMSTGTLGLTNLRSDCTNVCIIKIRTSTTMYIPGIILYICPSPLSFPHTKHKEHIHSHKLCELQHRKPNTYMHICISLSDVIIISALVVGKIAFTGNPLSLKLKSLKEI